MRPTRGRRAGDDTGSLAMAVLVVTLGALVCALLGPVVVTQVGTTQVELRRVHALHAAEAGLDVAVAQIRAADDGAGNGVWSDLPCGPLSGAVGGGGTGRYQVSIYYVSADPQVRMAVNPSWFAANQIACTTGSGPGSVPLYAVLYSTGTDNGASRLLRGAYRLRTTNQNVLGGQIHLFYTSSSTADLCMDSGSPTSLAAGTPLRVVACDPTGTSQQQMFAYTTASTLMLVHSVTATWPLGLCLDAGATHATGNPVVFQPCQSPAPVRQQWIFNGDSQFEGVVSGTITDGYVFQLPAADTPGSVFITNTPVWDGSFNNINGFQPDPSVGPGNAGPQNKQLVNYAEFGRCLDLNGGNAALGYLIAWQCKPSWNQAVNLPPVSTTMGTATPGLISMDVPAGAPTPQGLYCLQSPRSTAFGAYPSMVACTSTSTAPALQWQVYAYTGDYPTSYRVVDVDGNCLQAADPNAVPSDTDAFGPARISRIEVRACSDSTLQKWNADPYLLDGVPLKYVGEN